MADPRIRAVTAAVSFGVYADLAYNIYSATNSSPQTTELFAGERSDSLWKYVLIGHVQAVGLGVFGSILDKTLWPLLGTVSIGAIMHGMYAHALQSGKDKAPPSNSLNPDPQGGVKVRNNYNVHTNPGANARYRGGVQGG
jgi:hypothetical protein